MLTMLKILLALTAKLSFLDDFLIFESLRACARFH